MTDNILPLGNAATAMDTMPALSMKLGSGANIDKTAQDFEAMFATQLLSPMFEGISADPTFGGGHGEEAMRSFMLQEYGKMIAKTGKLGIASQVKAEMLRAQEHGRAGGGLSRAAQNAYANANNQGDGNVAN